ncbi:unnamed protein product [Brachionus calyciflorus]|uniref:Uncharacterized protein n=1 Tax=Brachionus calyciflorus TaxID=104777 RepID=A0A814MIG3_9BILA|nr:unnamed protein product [Brachionus calyciflorus]
MKFQKETTRGLLFVVAILCLVKCTHQQFSYSANWGKRNTDDSKNLYENKCKNTIRLKEFLIGTIENLDEKIKDYLDLKIMELCASKLFASLEPKNKAKPDFLLYDGN